MMYFSVLNTGTGAAMYDTFPDTTSKTWNNLVENRLNICMLQDNVVKTSSI